ncbi:DUF4168 domain-containing protein [Gallaecimonas xiamenensis]|uniref:DUF4168 domain-containing protein n=1 Tax=Gallaecimonas xiamenensis 3-C-1 TaxID=745411 RepID=K2JPF3_9GAMM|nr:DUF4168 domain-containing protein [Gallaecimonas xiamenensis]EKE72354.1 hypothetical protein B3C1_10997 [Gallaecimonas xiamenensis 3-C-1]
MRNLMLSSLLTVSLAGLPMASLMAAPAPQGQQAQALSDSQLEQFHDAQKAISGIRDSAMEKLNASENPDEAQQIQQQANEQMIAAVKDAGLTVEDYNQIARAVQTDPTLRARLGDMD